MLPVALNGGGGSGGESFEFGEEEVGWVMVPVC